MLHFFYILLSLIMIHVLILGSIKLAFKTSQPRFIYSKKVFAAIFFWILYLYALSKLGLLHDLSLPPRLPLLIFVPFGILTLLFCRKAAKSSWIKHIPLTWLTFPQVFRIAVEILLYFTFLKNIIPIEATFEGLNFDILMGISAPFVGWYLLKTVKPNYQFLMAWNILGILMIAFVAFIIGSNYYLPEIWGNKPGIVSFEFIDFPMILLAGFLAPLGIFLHALSITKITIQVKRLKDH